MNPLTLGEVDPLPLAQELLRRRSVTPDDDGLQAMLAERLQQLGFTVTHLRFGRTPNLFARIGTGASHLCFAGHTDVVPAGDTGWTTDPFGGEVRDGVLFGRGACDMKGAVAAFVAAAEAHLPVLKGSISLLITGDEEGPATDGTVRVLEWMQAEGHLPDLCLVGEPTNQAVLGDVVKIGRRGSMSAQIRVLGVQGHSAYPQKADNPIHRLVPALAALTAAPLDAGTERFEPSTLQLTSVDVGNPASNVIPPMVTARLNIRFNDLHTGAALHAWLRATFDRYCPRYELDVSISGEAFLTQPGPLVGRLQSAIARAAGVTPRLDTGGGTSDARFIAKYCPVAEFGLVGLTMHKVDECVPIEELRRLTSIYGAILAEFV